MSVNGKRILSILTYYTLFGLAIIMSALTILYVIGRNGVPMWATILYTIWACAVIGTLIFDIICTSMKRLKFISGLMVYVLSAVAIVVTAVLYLVRSGLATGLLSTFMPIYIGVAALILSTTLYMIATYVVGEAVVEHVTAMRSMKQKSNNQ